MARPRKSTASPAQRELFAREHGAEPLRGAREAQVEPAARTNETPSVGIAHYMPPRVASDVSEGVAPLPAVMPNARGPMNREDLYGALCTMLPPQFDRVIFELESRVGLRRDMLAPDLRASSERATNLIQFLEQRNDGLRYLEEVVLRLIPDLRRSTGGTGPIDPNTNPVIIIEMSGTRHRWRGGLGPERIADVCWGTPGLSEPHARPANVYFNAGWAPSDRLAKAFARLIVHEGARYFSTPEADEWKMRLHQDVPGCLGTRRKCNPICLRCIRTGSRTFQPHR